VWNKEITDIDENGNFYAITAGTGTGLGQRKIKVEQWKTK